MTSAKMILTGLCALAVVTIAVSAEAGTTAYWRFEGNSGGAVTAGTAVPSSGTPLIDEVSGSVLYSYGTGTAPTWEDGVFGSQVPLPDASDVSGNGTFNNLGVNGRSVNFTSPTGGQQLVTSGDSDGADFGLNQPFTIEGYIKTEMNPPNDIRLLQKRASAAPYQGYSASLTSAGFLMFHIDDGPQDHLITANDTIINDNAWHHIAATRDVAGDIRLFVDGVEDTTLSVGLGSSTGINQDISNDSPLNVGAGPGHFRPFLGSLDELRFSNIDLSPSQFLNAPEPSSVVLLMGAIGCMAIRRPSRRR